MMKPEPHDGILVVISGPSGTGKDTIVSELKKIDGNICSTVSATTRKPRKNEIDGEHYHFISVEEFENRINNNEFIEYVKYGNNYYGTLRREIDSLINCGKVAVMVIEVNGAQAIMEKFPGVLSIFVTAPSEKILEERLRWRAEETEEAISTRLEISREEMKRKDEYDFVVVNDVLEAAVERIYRIIKDRINKPD